MPPVVDVARRVADTVLAPAAGEVDATAKIPSTHFDALAEAGLYGTVVGDERPYLAEVAETVISGCLATGFVWAQHHGVAAALAGSPLSDLASAVASGDVPAGVTYAGLASHGRTLAARRSSNGYLLSGTSAFVTGWGIVGMLGAWAHDADAGTARLFAIRHPDIVAGITSTPLDLVAAQGSNTVTLAWDGVEVSAADEITSVPADRRPRSANLTIRLNAALALGVCRSALRELDRLAGSDGRFAATATGGRHELTRIRSALDASMADGDALYRHRADANALAMRLATAVAAATGSTSVLSGSTAERLVREALFCTVCASRPAIRDELLDRLIPGEAPS